VDRLCLFNTIAPVLPGTPRGVEPLVRMAADYFVRQSRDADGLAAELDSPELRRRYVAQFYGPRFWAAPGAFESEDVKWLCEPFGDRERFRASIANYEYAGGGPRTAPELPRVLEPNPVPALVLYGPEDHVIPRDFPERMEAAFPNICGPFVVPRAGHFMQWERSSLLAGALRWMFGA
jgi:pimeloyl-ACP methyl ester carboxylesterase